jgi:two-component system repressor protein LuxO
VTRFAAEDSKHFTGLDATAERRLAAYGWPGNVRELQNVIRHAVVLNQGPLITETMLTLATRFERVAEPAVAMPAPAVPASAVPEVFVHQDEVIRPLADVERETINRAIAQCGGDVPKAAVALGISASTIYRKRQSWAADRA